MPSASTARFVRELSVAARNITAEGAEQQQVLIESLAARPLGTPAQVIAYHDALLFILAYPVHIDLVNIAQSELDRVVDHVKERSKGRTQHEYQNSGIAGSITRSTFSLALNSWLIERFGEEVELWAEGLDEERVVNTLNHMLDPVEYEMLHAGKMTWDHWSASLVGKGASRHHIKKWIVETTQRLPGSTALREYVFSQFALTTQWKSGPHAPSMTSGRAPFSSVYLHTDGAKKRMTLEEAFALAPPREIALTTTQQRELCDLAKGVLCLQLRETDPVTHAAVSETSYFDMGRGLTIALYAMKSDMKMALQSYIGFMAFKNGIPCAYGGGWLLNDDSGFGVNIFPPFRGGESAVVVCQLLRLYRHTFNVKTFNVDPYQIGYGNPDGIASGAFWFYYRLGFRPVERHFLKLATDEARAMKEDRSYRSAAAVLKTLAESTMRWTDRGVKREAPITADVMGDVVSAYVNTQFDGDRQAALKRACSLLSKRSGRRIHTKHPAARIAVLLMACGYAEQARPAQLRKFLDSYAVKHVSERDYVRASQHFPDLFRRLHESERSL